MASSATNSATNSGGINHAQPAFDTDTSSENVSFAKRSVKCILVGIRCILLGVVGLGTILFPVAMSVALISELCYSYGDTDKSRSVRIKRAVVAMMFAVPIIGPIVTRPLSNELIMYDKEIIPKDNIGDNDYFITCLPFYSTLLINDHMINHFLGFD
ncbi:MAG: EI24 domain-containing protein [Endozoicomonadaceae bacterium]|nr:EI24 domain-containing protein [Endozoicomonadaceae bacterium]